MRALALTIGFLGATHFAAAQAAYLELTFTASNTQTGPSQVVPTGFSAMEYVPTNGVPGDPTSVSVTRPNGTVDSLSEAYNDFSGGSIYSSSTALNTAFGLGNYTFSGNASWLPAVLANNYSMWAPVPEISNCASLANLSAAAGLNLMFNGFTPDPNANVSYAFLSITDVTNYTFPVDEFLSPSAQNFDIAPGVLTAGDRYLMEIDYNNEVYQEPYPNINGAVPVLGYTESTLIGFTAVLEPAPMPLFAVGLLGLAARRRKSKHRGVRRPRLRAL